MKNTKTNERNEGSRGVPLRQHPQYISPALIEMIEMGPE